MIEFTIKDIDLKNSLDDIKRYSKEAKDGIWNAVEITARKVTNNAQVNLKANRSYKTGELSVSLQQGLKLNKTGFSAKVGSEKKYAAYVEFGTPPHIIRVKNKKVLARYTGTSGGKEGFEIFGKEVHHPGSLAKPYLHPAVESERGRFEQRIKQALEKK
jgi:hypothetical protein